MKKFRVKYYFDGNGEVIIKAKSRKGAEKIFREGGYDEKYEKEWGEDYCVEIVEEL